MLFRVSIEELNLYTSFQGYFKVIFFLIIINLYFYVFYHMSSLSKTQL